MSAFEQDLLNLCSDPDSSDDIKALDSLLSRGVNPNIRNVELKGWTPLIIACTYNKCNIALQLLKHPKIKPQMSGNDGFDALYYASKYCSDGKIIAQLLKKGCNSNKCNIHGMTALFASVANNQLQNVKALLLDPLLNVNQKNQYGGSAVHHCAYATDNVLIAECLVKHGANLFMKDYQQKMPIHVANCYQRPKLFEFFKNSMKEQKPNWRCTLTYNSSKNGKMENGKNGKLENGKNGKMKNGNIGKIEMDAKMDENDIKHNNIRSNKKYKHSNNYNSGYHGISGQFSCVKIVKKEKRSRSSSPINFPSTPPLISITKNNDNRNFIRFEHNNNNVHPQQRYAKQNQEFQQQMMLFARKVENIGNPQVMNLLQEQQYLLSYEQQMLYEQCKYEYCKMEDKYKHTQLLLHQYQQQLQSMINGGSGNSNNNNGNDQRRSLSGQQFCEWFSTHINLMEYLQIFIDAGYDDIVCLPYLKNEQRLIQLGIKKPGHRLRICAAIEKYLLENGGCNVADEDGGEYQREGEKGTL